MKVRLLELSQRWGPVVAMALLVIEPALAQGVNVGGGGDWLATIVQTAVSVFVVGLIEIAVIWVCVKAIAGEHYLGATIGVVIGCVALVKYQTIAGWVSQGIGGLGGGTLNL